MSALRGEADMAQVTAQGLVLTHRVDLRGLARLPHPSSVTVSPSVAHHRQTGPPHHMDPGQNWVPCEVVDHTPEGEGGRLPD